MPRPSACRFGVRRFVSTAVFAALACVSMPADAGSHLWKVNELFSNPDGTVQFVELKECCGSNNEVNLNGVIVHSVSTTIAFTFPSNIPGPTGNKHLLLATAAFAALPGAPTPDFIIPDGLIDLAGDTIWYGQAQNYDSFMFTSGQLPTDGTMSMQLTSFTPDTFTIAANTPTNLAGQTGTVTVGPPPADADFTRGDCNVDGSFNIADPVNLLGFLFPNGPGVSLECDDACDANDDGSLNVADAVAALGALFGNPTVPLTGPLACGADVAADALACAAFSACP
ncbi:MAG: hypothetical protein AAF581_06285 [Planctomycetota bacterium]